MFSADDTATYIERAEMHEQLAAATGDVPARKMHLAMAAAYRRKLAEIDVVPVAPQPTGEHFLKFDLSAP